jgi:hypothetical protein
MSLNKEGALSIIRNVGTYNMDDRGLTKTWKGSGLYQQH